MKEIQPLKIEQLLKDLGIDFDQKTGGHLKADIKGTVASEYGQYCFQSHVGDITINFNDGDIFMKSLSKTEEILKIKLFV